MPRVLYAPRNISGQATEYVEAVRPFGFDGEVWSFGEPVFGFGADRVLDTERMLTDPAHRWDVFDQAVRRFDIFHLQYSRSLLAAQGHVLPELWDLPLLRSLGKRVFMHFRGSDVRSRTAHLAREPDSYFLGNDVVPDEDRMQGRIAICRRFCDAMLVSTPGLLDDVPDAVWIPHVVDVPWWRTPRPSEPSVPVVVHLPSSRSTKGSERIEPVLHDLDGRGVIRYRPLDGLDRPAMRAALQDADVVVDSLGIGDNGLISVEAMAAGAIPIAHLSAENRRRNAGTPVVEATFETLGTVITELAADPTRRQELRRAGHAFVTERHERHVVGAQLADLYRTPPGRVDRSYPDWPRSEPRSRVLELEARIDALEAAIDPDLRGAGTLLRSLPQQLVHRLTRRIDDLESSLRALDPEHPALARRGRLALPSHDRDARDIIKAHPRLHRVARRVALTVRDRLGR